MNGAPPVPKIMPMEIITPGDIDRSVKGDNFRMVARPTGKNAREKVAWRMRVTRIIGRMGEKAVRVEKLRNQRHQKMKR
jgi:hypothetical protein